MSFRSSPTFLSRVKISLNGGRGSTTTIVVNRFPQASVVYYVLEMNYTRYVWLLIPIIRILHTHIRLNDGRGSTAYFVSVGNFI